MDRDFDIQITDDQLIITKDQTWYKILFGMIILGIFFWPIFILNSVPIQGFFPKINSF